MTTVLHILKTEPDEAVRDLIAAFAEDDLQTVSLDDDQVDWEALVDMIFAADKVICWW